MVNNTSVQLDRVFGALADPTRRAILERLAHGEITVTALADPFPSSLPAISRHLRVLESAGLIVRRAAGRQRICKMTPAAMDGAAEWMDYYRRFWTERLDALEDFLNDEDLKEKTLKANDLNEDHLKDADLKVDRLTAGTEENG